MCAVSSAQSPDFSNKFGKVTDYELKMTKYDADTSAHAVVIYEDVLYQYSYSDNAGFKMHRYYETKIKILDQEGASWGDVVVYYRYSSSGKEYVSKIAAASYNLENGKVVKKTVGRKDIFKENVSENLYREKFSIPDVKAGTVIEFKYMISSDFIYNIPSVRFQYSIPVISKTAEVMVPEFYNFSVNVKGHNQVLSEQKSESRSIGSGPNTYAYSDNVYKFTATGIPALKNEPYVWCKEDFTSVADFELRSVHFPRSPVKSFAYTWKDVNETLNDNSSFSAGLNTGNHFKKEVEHIMAGDGDDYSKLRLIHKLIMSKIAWNDHWRLSPKNVRDAVKTGSGSSADINFALLGAVKAAGYEVVPVLLNPRQYGRLPYTHPSIDKINTVVLMVTLPSGGVVFVDGTDRNSDLNMLREELMVDRARIYGVNSEEGWVDLTRLSDNRVYVTISGSVDDDGVITGRIENRMEYAPAFAKKRGYNAAKSEDDYIEELEQKMNISIQDYSISGLDSCAVAEIITFTKKNNKAGDRIYLNSTLLPFMHTNPFPLQERKMPVEFSFPYSYRINANIVLPEGYVVEESPANVSYAGPKNEFRYTYKSQNPDGMVNMTAGFDLKQIIFPTSEFETVYNFYGTVANAAQRRIVLKKE